MEGSTHHRVTLVHHRSQHYVHFFLDFIFQSLNSSSSCNKTFVADFSMKMEGRIETMATKKKAKKKKH
jgi:hypothetical protein